MCLSYLLLKWGQKYALLISMLARPDRNNFVCRTLSPDICKTPKQLW
jgi:hypothetical protein